MGQVTDDPGRRRRLRRQGRAAVTILLVLAGLAAAFYYANSYFQRTAPKAAPCMTVPTAPDLAPRDVSLRVYNSTERAGLAAATAKVAASRGFRVKQVANDPLNRTIGAPAEIRYGKAGEASAKVVARHVPGAALKPDQRGDDSVDLVLGNGWKAFGPVPAPVTATPTPVPCPSSSAKP
ncbi:MAG TPA: LytR C-terminal domain-containing protein [Intrasporangium sp.]|uniref:LytR C-terminal domain-containing protein n=1 Tax=Intrasporangium sp. TaxID=1925024 RepID=UPI002D76F676|nr:LytR C-terminal domain-containing protein [Intrasporangium sp.]HET7399442.1 LytR C-terminal domain-containing protein [Intrasporangium sp.]